MASVLLTSDLLLSQCHQGEIIAHSPSTNELLFVDAMSSGRLVISLKKSYCPFSSDNIAKYEAAEQRHREAQEAQRSTDRLARSRERRALCAEQRPDQQEQRPDQQQQQQHVHLFPEPPSYDERDHRSRGSSNHHHNTTPSNHRQEGVPDGRQRRHRPGTFGATATASLLYTRDRTNAHSSTTKSIQQQHDSLDPMKYFHDAQEEDFPAESLFSHKPHSVATTNKRRTKNDQDGASSDGSSSSSDDRRRRDRRRRRRQKKEERRKDRRKRRRRRRNSTTSEEESDNNERRKRKRRHRRHRSESPHDSEIDNDKK